jgi:Zinc knuckle
VALTFQCQKCLEYGHYSYECKAFERPYKARPTRTQILKNPQLLPKLSIDEEPNKLLEKYGTIKGGTWLTSLEQGLRIKFWEIRNRRGRRGDEVRVFLLILLLEVEVFLLILRIVRRKKEGIGRELGGIVGLCHHRRILHLRGGVDRGLNHLWRKEDDHDRDDHGLCLQNRRVEDVEGKGLFDEEENQRRVTPVNDRHLHENLLPSTLSLSLHDHDGTNEDLLLAKNEV